MIEQIVIKNFKSHKDTTLNLHEGVNIIYGNPQAGKSNIMRALELLLYNRPIGAKFMPKWAKKTAETEVYILDDECVKIGIKVICKRTKAGAVKRESTYYYIEDTATGDLWDSTGVGSEVPAEITKAINLTDINIQLQSDQPFLATSSGSRLSKAVNQITGLDIGDMLTSHLNKQFNEQAAIVKNISADLDQETENLKNFPDINKLESVNNRLEKILAMMEKADTRITSLNNYVSKLNDLGRLAEVPDLDQTISRAKKLTYDIDTAQTKIGQVTRGLKAIEGLASLKAVPNLGLIFARISLLNSDISRNKKIIEKMHKAIYLKSEFSKAKQAKDKAGKEYIQFLTDLEKCPTCFQSIDKDKLKQIIQGVG